MVGILYLFSSWDTLGLFSSWDNLGPGASSDQPDSVRARDKSLSRWRCATVSTQRTTRPHHQGAALSTRIEHAWHLIGSSLKAASRYAYPAAHETRLQYTALIILVDTTADLLILVDDARLLIVPVECLVESNTKYAHRGGECEGAGDHVVIQDHVAICVGKTRTAECSSELTGISEAGA